MAEGDDKTFTQADLDRIVGERLQREREKYTDYDELKAKAVKFDESEAKNKSDLEKANERAVEAERTAATAKAETLRLEVAAAKGVKPRYVSGTTREELEASADEYLKDHSNAGGAGEGNENENGGGGGGNGTPRKPVENLSGGGDPTSNTSTETDPAKLAADVPRY